MRLLEYLGISAHALTAGFSGGFVYILWKIYQEENMKPRKMIARLLMGAITANYAGAYIAKFAGVNESLAGFIVGLLGEELLYLFYNYFRQKYKRKA